MLEILVVSIKVLMFLIATAASAYIAYKLGRKSVSLVNQQELVNKIEELRASLSKEQRHSRDLRDDITTIAATLSKYINNDFFYKDPRYKADIYLYDKLNNKYYFRECQAYMEAFFDVSLRRYDIGFVDLDKDIERRMQQIAESQSAFVSKTKESALVKGNSPLPQEMIVLTKDQILKAEVVKQSGEPRVVFFPQSLQSTETRTLS